jgi:hypothetical protein
MSIHTAESFSKCDKFKKGSYKSDRNVDGELVGPLQNLIEQGSATYYNDSINSLKIYVTVHKIIRCLH